MSERRQRFTWLAGGAGSRWPEDAQVEGGVSIRPFNWVKISNHGAGDIVAGLTNPSSSDRDYLVKVKAGKVRVFNVEGPVRATDDVEALPHEFHMQAIAATTVLVEFDESPIVDMIFAI